MTRGGKWKEGEGREARSLDDPWSRFSASLKPPEISSSTMRLKETVRPRESETQSQPDLFLPCMEIKPQGS